jgi:hypothetical protein
MYINPKIKYRGNLTIDRQIWTKIYRCKWLLMKGCNKFWSRPKESNPSTMILFSEKTQGIDCGR